MSPRTALSVLALLACAPASAQVYKCTIDGRAVFSGSPCAIDAKPITVNPASGPGNYDDALRARNQARRDARAARDIEQQRSAARALRSRTHGGIGPAEKSDRCKEIERERASAEKWSQEYTHPDNIKREQGKLKHYEQRDFFECSRSNMR